jgi:uncharacterized protein YndB with AHSA1/START domain
MNETKTELKSERELLTTRSFDAPARIVFEAWTKPELMQRWWVPKSMGMTLLSCEMDVRVGGKYRLLFRHPAAPEPMAFFGTYKEVVANARLVWTNEESPDGAVTTVIFEEKDGKTTLRMHELFPSKEALEANGGLENALPETFGQLDELLAALGAGGSRS